VSSPIVETATVGSSVVADQGRPAIRTSALSKTYGKTVGLDRLDLTVPEGVVFGYLGPNGAGKTTTIRLLVGQLRPSGGAASVLGLDAETSREQVQRLVGYLPGDFAAYPDLTGQQYLTYLGNLRGGVDPAHMMGLSERLGLDLTKKIGSLSHGNRQKVGLVQAFMHRPPLLILDEPSSGLDPLVQCEFLAMVREARAERRTVFLSSHVLAEVEAVADSVGILREGRLVIVESVENLRKRALRRLELTFDRDVPIQALRAVTGVRDIQVDDRSALLVVEGSTAELVRVAAPHGVTNVRTVEAGLEQVFLSFYGEEV
jgi:ABC-2 type transport system ATP-binding protein